MICIDSSQKRLCRVPICLVSGSSSLQKTCVSSSILMTFYVFTFLLPVRWSLNQPILIHPNYSDLVLSKNTLTLSLIDPPLATSRAVLHPQEALHQTAASRGWASRGRPYKAHKFGLIWIRRSRIEPGYCWRWVCICIISVYMCVMG